MAELAARLATAFRAEWLVHEDADVLAIDKPVGVSCEPLESEPGADLPARLTRYLAERDAPSAPDKYLGAQQRLDAAMSGVVLYARRREANAGLARQLEARDAVRELVAGVTGWTGEGRVLRHRLGKGDGARLVRVGARDSRGKDAEAHVRVLERRGDRALLLCRVAAGGPLTLRTQLALEGAVVVGDTLYTPPARDDVSAAPRLLLHAQRLALRHPLTDAPLELVAPLPRVFRDWLERGDRAPFDDAQSLRDRLEDAMQARFGLAQLAHAADPTTAYRLVHEHGDGLPGLAVDVYGEHLVAQLLGDEASAHADALFDALAELGFAGVYAKHRPKQANVVVDTRRDELAPKLPVRGLATPEETLLVHEHGLPLEVRLGDGLSTGVFLDQRESRRRVRELSRDARVLNLFAYTCAFSAAAAAGGARLTLSVDASRDALAWGERNVARAREAFGTTGDDQFLRADVFDALARLSKSGERFDLVIVDPPTYATTRASRWTSGASWRGLVAQCAALLAPGGRLLASSNDRRLPLAKFRRLVHEGARDAEREVTQLKELPTQRDFPVGAGREAPLKSVLVSVE
jgi:23S rRNA (cytosine1962-C5)-methyltransferase